MRTKGNVSLEAVFLSEFQRNEWWFDLFNVNFFSYFHPEADRISRLLLNIPSAGLAAQ